MKMVCWLGLNRLVVVVAGACLFEVLQSKPSLGYWQTEMLGHFALGSIHLELESSLNYYFWPDLPETSVSVISLVFHISFVAFVSYSPRPLSSQTHSN